MSRFGTILVTGGAGFIGSAVVRHLIGSTDAGVVNVVGVAGLGESSAMRDFVADTGTEGITHIDDSSGEIWASYEIYSQPAFAFITDDGRLETYVGSLGSEGLTDIIEKLIVA